jgi:CMP-N-acetylneuraminic acid synthetase
MTEKILAVVPARGGKDEVEHMNIRELGGQPLIYYTIRAALNSEKINRIIVSTEDKAVAKIAIKNGAEVPFLRPENLCGDDTTLADVIKFILDKLKETESYTCDIIVVLLPNTPFKASSDIDVMIEQLKKKGLDSVIPLCSMSEFFWRVDGDRLTPDNFDHRKRRIDATPLYVEKGGIYIYEKDVFAKAKGLKLGRRIGYHLLSRHNAQTIHAMYDFFVLERLVNLPLALINEIIKHE